MNNEKNDLPFVDRPAPTAEQPAQAFSQESAPEPAGPRLRDRVLGLRAVAGVAIASVILGAAGGAALGAVSAGDNGDGAGVGGPGRNGQPPGGQQQFQQGGPPGQLPPGIPPDQDGGGLSRASAR